MKARFGTAQFSRPSTANFGSSASVGFWHVWTDSRPIRAVLIRTNRMRFTSIAGGPSETWGHNRTSGATRPPCPSRFASAQRSASSARRSLALDRLLGYRDSSLSSARGRIPFWIELPPGSNRPPRVYAPVAQWIERLPPEQEVACSSHAGRTRTVLTESRPRFSSGAASGHSGAIGLVS